MATGSVIDSKIVVNGHTVNNVVIAGTKVFRVVANGHITYDRKEYTFSKASNYSYSAPVTGGTITLPSTAITSTYSGYNPSGTRVNDAAADYSISPASLSSNSGNTTSKSGTLTLTQDNSQLTLSVSYTQPADSYETQNIITGLSLSLSNAAVIPASGGSVNSCDVSVTALGYERYLWNSGAITSGGNVTWALDTTACTYSWTGVTAQSLSATVQHNQTTAGTLQCKATYKADHSITAQTGITVYQAKNEVTGYTPYTYLMVVSTNVTGNYTSVGGNVSVDYQAQRSRQPIYDSKTTGATTISNLQNAADLGANIGTMSSNSVNGTGTATLTVPQNTSSNRTITITLSASTDDGTKIATTSFTQYGSSAVWAYAYLSNYTGNGQITSWDDVNDVKKEITNWNSPTTSVYNVTADGVSKYRVGNTPSSNLVPVDTYFYKDDNDSRIFHTRVVSTAGAAGTEYSWYHNNNFNVGLVGGGTSIPSTATTFQLTGTTNTLYYITVKRGATTVYSKTLYTGGTITINCGANTSTTTDRVFNVTFTEYYTSVGNPANLNTLSITQPKMVTDNIQLTSSDSNVYTISGLLYWDYSLGGSDNVDIQVHTTGGTWTATYDTDLFTLSRNSGSNGAFVNVQVKNIGRWEEGEPYQITFTRGSVSTYFTVTYTG